MATVSGPRLSGVVPPVATPFTPDLDVDVASLLRLVDLMLDAGVPGLFVLGSSSEAAFLTDTQRETVIRAVTSHVAGQVPVLAGVIDMTTPRMADHAHAAVAAGCAGVVATAPFYAQVNAADTERHFRALAGRVELPVYAYNLPVAVHTTLSPGLLLDLAADGVLAGVKDSSGNDNALRRLLLARADRGDAVARFSVLTGSEITVDAALHAGADGTVPGLGNVDPHGFTRLYRAARSGDWAAARAEQDRLTRLFDIVDVVDPARTGFFGAAIGAFKMALHLRGIFDCPLTAPPLGQLTDEDAQQIKEKLAAAGLL